MTGVSRGGIVLASLLLAPTAPALADTVAPSCDAACLTAVANNYMDALAAQDSAKVPWGDKVTYEENSVGIMVDDGVWATATARSPAPLVVATPEYGHVAWIGSIDEHGQPAFYAMDMGVDQGKVVFVNAVIRRKEGRPPFSNPTAFAHDPLFFEAVAKEGTMTRDQMIALAETFFDQQAGESTDEALPFDKGCKLIENGVAMSGLRPAAQDESGECESSFKRGLFKEVETVRRYFAAIDEARGVLVAIGFRDLPANRTTFKDATGKAYASEADYPRSVGFVTAFKMDGGKIMRVETIANELPLGMMPARVP